MERVDLAAAKRHLADLFAVRREVYWADMVASALLGWAAFGVAVACGDRNRLPGSAMGGSLRWFALILAVVLLYRAMAFVHEISHHRESTLPGFAAAWNLLIGFPMLWPTAVYADMNLDHHRPALYGTSGDPEYEALAGAPLRVARILAQPVFVPILVAVRFLVLAPLGWALPPLHRILEKYASAMPMNLAYTRDMTAADRRGIYRTEAGILVFWLAVAVLAWRGLVPPAALALWYLSYVGIMALNVMRALASHRYASTGEAVSHEDQILDSLDTPGGPWTEIWAPVGLRYHALHHAFPGLPYHDLGTAYRRLVAAREPAYPLKESAGSSLLGAIAALARPSARRPAASSN